MNISTVNRLRKIAESNDNGFLNFLKKTFSFNPTSNSSGPPIDPSGGAIPQGLTNDSNITTTTYTPPPQSFAPDRDVIDRAVGHYRIYKDARIKAGKPYDPAHKWVGNWILNHGGTGFGGGPGAVHPIVDKVKSGQMPNDYIDAYVEWLDNNAVNNPVLVERQNDVYRKNHPFKYWYNRGVMAMHNARRGALEMFLTMPPDAFNWGVVTPSDVGAQALFNKGKVDWSSVWQGNRDRANWTADWAHDITGYVPKPFTFAGDAVDKEGNPLHLKDRVYTDIFPRLFGGLGLGFFVNPTGAFGVGDRLADAGELVGTAYDLRRQALQGRHDGNIPWGSEAQQSLGYNNTPPNITAKYLNGAPADSMLVDLFNHH
jgi:hypothetical protein